MTFRRAAKKDANHNEIANAFVSLGYSVLDVSQLKNCCDLIAAKGTRTIAVEVKDGAKPPSARKLSEGEVKFKDCWLGEWALVESVDDVICLHRLENAA